MPATVQNLVARHYTPADFEVVNAWCIDHLTYAIDERRLPPLGIMIEDEKGPVFVLFAHLSVNIGMAFLDHPVSRPRLQQGQARRAFAYAMGTMRETLKALDYGLMVCYGNSIEAREMSRNHGFIVKDHCIRMEAPV